MARIEHRRNVRRYPTPPDDAERDPDDLAEDAVAPAPVKPWASLDQVTWLGWLCGGLAIGWLIINVRPLFHAGAFGEAELTQDVVTLVQAIAAAAALALPAALERGAAKAWQRARWVYVAAVALAFAELSTILVQQVRERFLADVDVSDPNQPITLAYVFLSLIPVIASIVGLLALAVGLRDLGARARTWFLVVVGIVVAAAMLVTYLPYFGQMFSLDAMLVTVLNAIRLTVSLVLLGSTAVAGAALLTGAIGNLTPRAAWVLAGLSGACYFLSTLGRIVLGITLSQDTLTMLSYVTFALEAAAPVLLLLSFAAGLARTVDLPVPARRIVARWVRYPAA